MQTNTPPPPANWGREPCQIPDSPEVAALRGAEDYDGLLALGKALCFQLRYREAVEVYDRAAVLCPTDIRAYRQRAARYLTTLRPEDAICDLLRCRALGGDEMDLSYRLGLCRYLTGAYRQAMAELETCYPLCDEEMGIAAMFWHTLSAWRAGEAPGLLRHYRPGMAVGHHTAYDFCMALAAGFVDLRAAEARLKAEKSDLEYSILAYGVSGYLEHTGKDRAAEALRERLLRRDSFWITYCYIAAWNDRASDQQR